MKYNSNSSFIFFLTLFSKNVLNLKVKKSESLEAYAIYILNFFSFPPQYHWVLPETSSFLTLLTTLPTSAGIQRPVVFKVTVSCGLRQMN